MTIPRPARIDSARCHAFANEWIAAWNSHDLDRILSHYPPTLELTSPLILRRYPESDGTIRDASQLREYFAKGLAAAPDLHFELIEVLRAIRGFSIYYVNARGGRTAEYIELDDDDRARVVIACYTD